MTRHLIRDIMRTGGPVLSPADPIRQAVARLVKSGEPAAAVTSPEGALAGILTQKDCFRPALGASYYQEWRGSVAEFMTPEVMTMEASRDVIHAAEVFLDIPHRVLPVVEGDRLLGMLDRADVLALLSRYG